MNHIIRCTNCHLYHLSPDQQVKELKFNASNVYILICEYLLNRGLNYKHIGIIKNIAMKDFLKLH